MRYVNKCKLAYLLYSPFQNILLRLKGVKAEGIVYVGGGISVFKDRLASITIGRGCRFMSKQWGNPPVLSEGALNKVCQEKVLFISPRWNMMSGLYFYGVLSPLYLAGKLTQYSVSESSNYCSNPVIIHYLTGFYNRPWYSPCSHPLKHLYYKYQRMSMWKEIEPTHSSLPIRLRLISFYMKHKVLIIKYISKIWMR